MPLLSAADRDRVREALAGLARPVRLVLFTQTLGCETCQPTRRILDELAELSEQITVEEHNFVLERDQAEAYDIDKVPAIAVIGEEDAGIRFYGMPSGYEFVALIDAVQLAAGGDAGLSDGSRALLAGVDEPRSLQVFVTPT